MTGGQSMRPLDPIFRADKKIATFAVGNSPGIPVPVTFVFDYTGAVQDLTIPTGYTLMTVEAIGGATGSNASGARVVASFPVVGGDEFDVIVGGNGDDQWPDGGNAGASGPISSTIRNTNGAGSSDVRTDGGGLADRLIVAGAGGGSGRHVSTTTTAGYGGYPDGGDGTTANSGDGGTGVAGGAGGVNGGTQDGTAGTLGQGGDGGVAGDLASSTATGVGGGGGGGGRYGGGGGAGAASPFDGTQGEGGGGGSSFVDGSGTLITSDDNYDLVGSPWGPDDWSTNPEYGRGRVTVSLL